MASFSSFEIDQAVRLHRQIGDPVAMFLQPLAGVQHALCSVTGDDVVALLAIHLGHALDRQVVALGGAAGENDLVGAGADQLAICARALSTACSASQPNA